MLIPVSAVYQHVYTAGVSACLYPRGSQRFISPGISPCLYAGVSTCLYPVCLFLARTGSLGSCKQRTQLFLSELAEAPAAERPLECQGPEARAQHAAHLRTLTLEKLPHLAAARAADGELIPAI